MKHLDNLHLFNIRFIGASNTRGSRVRIKTDRFQESVVIPYDYKFNSAYEVAQHYLESKGFNLIGMAETKNGYAILSSTFKPLKG